MGRMKTATQTHGDDLLFPSNTGDDKTPLPESFPPSTVSPHLLPVSHIRSPRQAAGELVPSRNPPSPWMPNSIAGESLKGYSLLTG